MKYHFNVGDYVETLDGRIGYIHEIKVSHILSMEQYFMTINFRDGEFLLIEYTDKGVYMTDDFYVFENYFVRIGKHQFRNIVREEELQHVEDVLNKFGVVVRDDNGYLPINEVMQDIAFKLRDMRKTMDKREYDLAKHFILQTLLGKRLMNEFSCK